MGKQIHQESLSSTWNPNCKQTFEPKTPLYESWKFLKENDQNEDILILDNDLLKTTFPQIKLNNNEIAIYDKWGGYIESGLAIKELSGLIKSQGVKIYEIMLKSDEQS